MAHCEAFFWLAVEFFAVTLSAKGGMILYRQYMEISVSVRRRQGTQSSASIKRVIINQALFLNME
jgi:hypothetical protein